MMRWKYLLLLMTLQGIVCNAAFADCQTDGTQANLLLLQFKQDALSGKHPDQNKFKAQFSPLVEKMKQGHCMNELMTMMTFIQGEQKSYPTPNQGKAASQASSKMFKLPGT